MTPSHSHDSCDFLDAVRAETCLLCGERSPFAPTCRLPASPCEIDRRLTVLDIRPQRRWDVERDPMALFLTEAIERAERRLAQEG